VQRGLPFSEEAGMTDQYAGRWSRPGPGLVAIENWKSVPHKRMLLDGKLPQENKGANHHRTIIFCYTIRKRRNCTCPL
jgi:hypothetical protein